jgi:uncharacterized protein (DUF3820 family)
MSDEVNEIPITARDAFWDEIKLSKFARDGLLVKEPVSLEPMTDEQADVFGLSKMPFGEFISKPINEVPMSRLEWYADSKFQKQLVRYLESPRVKQQRDLNNFDDV